MHLEERELRLDAVRRAAQLGDVAQGGDVPRLVHQREPEGLQRRLGLPFREQPPSERLAPLRELRLRRRGIGRGREDLQQPAIEADRVRGRKGPGARSEIDQHRRLDALQSSEEGERLSRLACFHVEPRETRLPGVGARVVAEQIDQLLQGVGRVAPATRRLPGVGA
jgi:hypothetical protein